MSEQHENNEKQNLEVQLHDLGDVALSNTAEGCPVDSTGKPVKNAWEKYRDGEGPYPHHLA